MTHPAQVHIRLALPEDLSAIEQIMLASPSAPQWNAGQLAEMLAAAAEETGALVRTVHLAETEAGIAGFAVVTALRVVYSAEAELESIAVAPEFRGRGIGRMLLEAAVGWAAANGAGSLRLEVRKSNITAISLYCSAGFEETGTRRGYYLSPVEDAVCMGRTIPPKGSSGQD